MIKQEPRLIVSCDFRAPEGRCVAELGVITSDATRDVALDAAKQRGWSATPASQYCPRHKDQLGLP